MSFVLVRNSISKFIYNVLIWQRGTCEESIEFCPFTKLSTFNNPLKSLWNTSAEGLVFSPVTFHSQRKQFFQHPHLIFFFILTFFSSHTHKCSFHHPFVSWLCKCICSIPPANRLEASYLRQEYVIMAFTRSLHCHRLKWLWLKRISNHFFLLHFFCFCLPLDFLSNLL